MKLSQLMAGLPVTGLASTADPEVKGVRHDSRQAEPGDLYVAWAGARHDGRSFAGEAVSRGAVAVLASGPPPAGVEVPWLLCQEPRALLGPLAARVHGHPERQLTLVGVTGTNGKSTVVELVAAILERAGRPTGRVGTLGYTLGSRRFAGERTTPEASELFLILRQMRDAGAEAVAMEVSSHALAQHRVAGLAFDVAAFTNLSRDHFDFHQGFDDYFAAKRRLFSQLADGGRAVLNCEDPYGRRLAAEITATHRVVRYGVGGEVFFSQAEVGERGSRGVVETPRGPLQLATPLLGRYNLANVLAAVATAEALELPQAAVAAAVAEQQPLPGRLEPVMGGQPFPIYIDYAHTDAALAAALASVKELGGRRLLAVFGCGGDRDPGKRALMGQRVGELADYAIVTSDNPRTEDPLAIIAAVEKGLAASGCTAYRVEPDRRRAIELALELAGPEWAVVIAGKGHEDVQIVGHEQRPFSDREEALRAVEERFGTAAHP